MDTARYRAFLMAAETGSIRNAAEVLGYTSSAVSQLIRALEEELKLTLFLRGKRGVTLTPAGEAALPLIRGLAAQENRLFQLAADWNGTVMGTVNVAAYHSLASAWMPEVLSTFQSAYPKVRVNLFVGTQQDIIAQLRSERCDVALFNDSAMSGKHDWIPLIDDPMLAVVPSSHPMAEERVFPIPRFAGERFIMPEHGYDFDVLNVLGEFHITPDVYLSTFDTSVLLEMVEKELGVSIINGTCLEGRAIPGQLRALPLDPPRSIQMGIAALSLRDAAPAVRKFVEVIKQVIEAMEQR